jgi:hypothetical protein
MGPCHTERAKILMFSQLKTKNMEWSQSNEEFQSSSLKVIITLLNSRSKVSKSNNIIPKYK